MWLAVVCSVAVGYPRVLAGHGSVFQDAGTGEFLQLSHEHEQVLRRWFERHRNFRLARLEDCEDRWFDSAGKVHIETCQQLIRELRAWTQDPAANPFYAKGDFNGDAVEDFATVLIDLRQSNTGAQLATVVVFNGPFRPAKDVRPAFSLRRGSVSATFLGYGPPRGKPWRLIIGSPESEGRELVWRNGKYVLR